ncbi:MAG: nitroreductase family protein [Oscillospiraceae bacterium]|nr:nitroreductase family protein [Oscillospiraceae bacterium]
MRVKELIRSRRSVRTFDGRELDESVKAELLARAEKAVNPFGIGVSFRFLKGKDHGLVCPVISGCDLYVGGKVEKVPFACAAFGYSFEAFILAAQSMGLGTVWLGGTMNRGAYEEAMALADNEMMPCATPVGYAAQKMSLKEKTMRKAVKADSRLAFEELFFDGDFDTPLTPEKAGGLAESLEMVRLAPSAVNHQPWRIVKAGSALHFYLKRSKGYSSEGRPDMQMVDMGIALCHFHLSAMESGLHVEFTQADPGLESHGGEYIASFTVK